MKINMECNPFTKKCKRKDKIEEEKGDGSRRFSLLCWVLLPLASKSFKMKYISR